MALQEPVWFSGGQRSNILNTRVSTVCAVLVFGSACRCKVCCVVGCACTMCKYNFLTYTLMYSVTKHVNTMCNSEFMTYMLIQCATMKMEIRGLQ